MKTSALYDAREHATATQRRELEARRKRLSLIGSIAKPDDSISCPSASARISALPDRPKRCIGGARNYKELFERAAAEHPIEPKREAASTQPEPWFRIVTEGYGPFVTIEQIQRAIISQFPGMTRRDLLAKRREKRLVRCRQIGFYICKALTQKSYPEIGRMFGGFDHTTILYAIRKIERMIRTDRALAQDVGEIINNLGCRDI